MGASLLRAGAVLPTVKGFHYCSIPNGTSKAQKAVRGNVMKCSLVLEKVWTLLFETIKLKAEDGGSLLSKIFPGATVHTTGI